MSSDPIISDTTAQKSDEQKWIEANKLKHARCISIRSNGVLPCCRV